MNKIRYRFITLAALFTTSAFALSRDLWISSTSDHSTQHAILFYSKTVRPRASLVFVHGMQSHAEWMRASGVGAALAESGITVMAYDRRGSGRSTTTRGHAADATTLLRDLNDARLALRHELGQDRRIPNPDTIEMHLMANCFGARIAVPYLMAAAKQNVFPFATLTLIAPSTNMKKIADYTFAEKAAILMRPKLEYVATPLQDEWFAAPGAGREWIKNDGLGLHAVTAGFLRATAKLSRRMTRDIYSMQFPLLIFTANRDTMVDSAGVKRELYIPYPGPKRLVEVDSEHSLEFSSKGQRALVRGTVDWILGSGREVWNHKKQKP